MNNCTKSFTTTSEYPCKQPACIRNQKPDCMATAVIPSITVEHVDGITDLANCLVHVLDNNTTYYIDDKHRIMLVWSGPVDIPGYDMETNPNNYRNQIVTDTEAGVAVIYNKTGVGFTFGIEQGIDVTEAVNNKLDEMAADGTLEEIVADYLKTKAIFAFDTVADMVASENLIDGSYAKTLGYYSANDGGASVYKIVNDDSTADDGSIIALTSGLKAKLIHNNSIRISQFGIDSDHNSNINNFIAYVNSNNLIDEIEFEAGIFYELDLKMAFTKKDLKINGNGATIKISNAIKRSDLFNITATNSCKIQDIIINGDEMPQDQWSEQVFANMSFRTTFRITSPNIIAENVRITNVWGQGLQLYGYESVDVHDCIFDKIGGDFWYHDAQTGAYDNIGDAVYLGGHSKDANISIDNCVFNGYENSDNTKNDSRCGIVFENLGSTYDLTGIKTNLTVNNTIIKNFSRALHHEAYHSLTHMVFDNCDLIKTSCILASSRNYTDLKIVNSRITYHNKINYMGSAGISSFNALVENTKLVMAEDYASYLSHNSSITYHNCTIDNLNGIVNLNGLSCILDECVINFNDAYNGSYLGGSSLSDTIFKNCVFNKNTQYLDTTFISGTTCVFYECTFNKVFPRCNPIFKDIKSVLNITSTITSFDALYTRRFFSKGTIYLSGVKYSVPNICGVLPAQENVYLPYGLPNSMDGNALQLNIGDSGVPIIPATLPTNIVLKRNSKYIMIIVGTNDWTQKFNNTLENFYYTDLNFNTSGVASISTISTKGTIPTSGALSFDTGTGTITRASGTSPTQCVWWILPYEYKYMLGLE